MKWIRYCQSLKLHCKGQKRDKIKAADSIMIPLHKESKTIRKYVNKLLERAKGLELALHYKKAGELKDDENISYLNVQKSSEQLEKEIELYCNKAKETWEKCKDHASLSGYAHYLQLHTGLLSFKEGLTTFLAGSSKKPHVVLELSACPA